MEAFISRQYCLQEGLAAVTNGQGITGHYNGSSRVEESQQLLQEAEACFELYEHFDNGVYEMLELREQRRWTGLSVDPVPSKIKCVAWSQLKVARECLAEAYYKSGHFESALPLYHLLVVHCLRMRTEVWDDLSTVPIMMNQLSACYSNLRHFESAKEWLHKAMHFCERDGLRELHEEFREHFAILACTKAGPVTAGDAADSKKHWKQCWWCEKAETVDCELSQCAKCVSLKLATPAFYCSQHCQEQDWPRHKHYHKQVKADTKAFNKLMAISANKGDLQQVHDGDEYMQLVLQSVQAQAAGNPREARRLAEKAIKMNPEEPSAYNQLANIFRFSQNYPGMIRCTVKVMDILEKCDWRNLNFGGMKPQVLWAKSAVSIFWTCLEHPAATSMLDNKPDWTMDPEKQLKMAKRVCEAIPDNHLGRWMRADAFEKMGELEKAIGQFSIAIEIIGSNEEGQMAVDRITRKIKGLQQKQEELQQQV